MEWSFAPTIEPDRIQERLRALLVCGFLLEARLEGAIRRVGRDFDSFASAYPLPLWAPGLVVTPEMRSLASVLLPYAPIRNAFSLLVRRSCLFTPLLCAAPLASAETWLDFLVRTSPLIPVMNASAFLHRLAVDEKARSRFLFALFLPRHYGGAFDRYLRQSEWIKSWLDGNRERLEGRVRALDCACGSGEGAYGLSELVAAAGFDGRRCVIHGSTMEHFELFAAAHAYFPHDLQRQSRYRDRIAPLLQEGAPRMEFFLDEVESGKGMGSYDLVLCNGLLGGPLLHGEEALRRAVCALAARLAPGGVLLAADRFHEGWRLKVPREKLIALLRGSGLEPVEIAEGIAGEKKKASHTGLHENGRIKSGF